MENSPPSAISGIVKPPPRSGSRSKLYGKETPRVWTPPLSELDEQSSLGFECIRFAEDILELELMPWQRWFLIHALELHPSDVGDDGQRLFRFRKIVLLVGRQNGKSTVMQAMTLWRMFVDRCNLVIGTAQDLEVAETLLKESYELAEEVEDLQTELRPLVRGSGKMSFSLKSGETYKVKAASRRGGRGLSGELVLLDELREHQSWEAWGAVTKTTNAKERAQIYGISNAGDAGSIVLSHLRRKAHADLGDPDGLNRDDLDPNAELPDGIDPEDLDLEDDDSLAIFEWSAPPGCDIHDRDGWAQSNPALGFKVREGTLASDASTDPEWVFRTECLCQWSAGSLEGPFPPGAWELGVDKDSSIAPDSRRGLCVDVSHDRAMSYIAIAGHREDGNPHGEVIAQRAGTAWLAGWFQDKPERLTYGPVCVQAKGAPASSLLEELQAVEGLEVVEWSGSSLGSATGALYDAVRCEPTKNEAGETVIPKRIYHRPQPVLDIAAATAVPKLLGESYVWSRAKSPTDAAPLVALTGALWVLNRPSEAPRRSKYEDRDLLAV